MLCVCMCVCMCMCVCVHVCMCACVRERVYADRLYFKLAPNHSRGNLYNAEDVWANV